MEENIERPVRGAAFHAEGEWAVPEGYEAEIKDGKIIVRKKESEDETIRKNIISFLESHVPDSPTSCIGKTEMINWLEKQKDSKWSPSEDEMGVLYKLCYISNQVTDEDDTELTRLYQDLKREYFNGHSFENMFPSEKQKEQKPAERSEEDERVRTQLLDFLEHLHSQGATMDFDVWSKDDCANWIAYLEKQKELNPELLKELNKGFKQAIIWGREGYEVSPDGKVRALNQDEIDEVEGKIKGSLHIHESCKDNADSLTDENEHQCDCEHVGCHINNCRRWCRRYMAEIPYTNCGPTCSGYSHKNTEGISVMKPTWTGNDSMALVSLKAIINNSNHNEARKKELLDWIDGRLGPQDGELMWLFAKAGTKFPADALVVGTGEDKDPRIVRCAVNDCYYLVVSDILPPKSVTDKLVAQYGESHGEPAPDDQNKDKNT